MTEKMARVENGAYDDFPIEVKTIVTWYLDDKGNLIEVPVDCRTKSVEWEDFRSYMEEETAQLKPKVKKIDVLRQNIIDCMNRARSFIK